MKQHRDLSLWLLTLIAGSSAASVACVDDVGGPVDVGMGTSGTMTGGTSAGEGGSGPAGTGGVPVTMGGSSATAGMAPVAGTAPVAGSGGMGGGGAGGGGGSAGAAGGGGTGGVAGIGPFGIVSCQPAFEVACKPNIVFENGDPNGRGKVFTNAVPDVETTMKDIACTACSILYRTPDEIPNNKHPSTITLKLDDHGGVAQAGGGQIQFDLDYINSYANRTPEVIKREMLGVLQHETVHLYQNYGTGGTGEGLADLVRARTGYYERSRWRANEGDWMTAYTASGNFYSWLTGPCVLHMEHRAMHDLDLPYKINKALAGVSGNASFTAVNKLLMTTFGKSAEELWDEYQDQAF
jgi:hypothetical protein